MKDQRIYGKFTEDFPDHPKIMPLSDAAFRCLVEATLWSRKHRTDGLLARRYAVARWSLSVLTELCENDAFNPSLSEVEDGWIIHDFALHQETRAEIEARSERNKIAGQKGGLAKAKQGAKQGAKRKSSERLAEKEKEKHITEVTPNVVTSVGRRTGKRLPDGWQPAPDVIAQMRSDHPQTNLEAETAKFVDYWHAKTGNDATKLDWNATWRNWIRRASEQNPRAPNGHRLPTSDQRFLDAQALKTQPSKLAQLLNPTKEIT